LRSGDELPKDDTNEADDVVLEAPEEPIQEEDLNMNLMPTMPAYVAETHVDPVWQVATDVEQEVTPKARSLSIGSMSVCSF